MLLKLVPVLLIASTAVQSNSCGGGSGSSSSGGSSGGGSSTGGSSGTSTGGGSGTSSGSGSTGGSTAGSTAGSNAGSTTGSTAGSTTGTAGANVVSVPGIAAWDALSETDKAQVNGFASLYLHQSVGQDLEDGAEGAGFSFEYYGPNQASIANKPNGGIFVDVSPGLGNGQPMQKLAVFEQKALAHKSSLRVAMMSFGYADVAANSEVPSVAEVQTAYAATVGRLKTEGIRVLHITPPLVYDTAENQPKQQMRQWMLTTFPNDTIFDLQDIESQYNGTRCEVGGVWRICQENRSTESCPSKGQGVDGPGQGHICYTRAIEFSKALLFAIRRAGL